MSNKYILLDGACGTMLQKAGLPLGANPEIFGIEHPDIMLDIHRQYVAAGSQVIYSNTFGANPYKLKNVSYTLEEIITKAVSIAKSAAADQAKVALDVGPIGALLEPLGDITFEAAYENYKTIVTLGEKAGADLVIFETMTNLNEVRAAVLAAKENTSLPVWVTMSFEKNGRTFTGTLASSMAVTLEGLGVDAIGVNCSLGPVELEPIIKELKQYTHLPVILKPNAGLPDPATGAYNLSPDDFADAMAGLSKYGITYFGGCCGTSPEYIKAVSEALRIKAVDTVELQSVLSGICTANLMKTYGGVRVIGERINPTGKKIFQKALRDHDLNYIMSKAIEQAEAGADLLDINVGLPGIDEVQMMTDVVKAVQSVTDLPLQIDSSNPLAIEAGLRACNGKAIVNSVNAEQETLDQILPIVKKYGAAVVGLTMDKQGIPESREGRYKMAEHILNEALKHGIPKEDVLIDCLTLTVSAQQNQAMETLHALQRVHDELGLHCVLGVSNISFGLPGRNHITTSFLSQAMYCGLDFPIINPNQKEIMDAVAAYKALSGEDEQCAAYIERFSDAQELKVINTNEGYTVRTAVLKGLKEETGSAVLKLLADKSEIDIINEDLIPALDEVGELYEKQKLFLPQLILSANAACAGFDVIKENMSKKGSVSVAKGKIIMATVQGDIHDLGKNIVKVILENYGYQVIDLGTDVAPETVVETAIKEQVKLISLSALMTTTVVSMKKTIEALRQSGHPCKVMVGGAVLTEEYASEIGADYFTKDAKASVDVAKAILG